MHKGRDMEALGTEELHSPGISRSLDACYGRVWHTYTHPHDFHIPAASSVL